MRSINYHIATSADGFISNEDGTVDGLLMEGQHADDFVKSLEDYDTVLMGRKTYEFGFQYGLEPGQPAYPNLKHYTVSQSLDFASSDNVRLIKSNLLQKISELKQLRGKEIWLCGGGELAGSLLEHNLIDKLTLKINPVIFGSGRKLFGESNKVINLNVKSNRVYENGVQLIAYDIVNSA